MTLDAHQKLIRYWTDTRADINFGPSSEDAVASIEAKYGVELPAEFRTYLREASPTDDQVDDNVTQWWSLRRIKNIPDEYDHEVRNVEIAQDAAGFLFFADYVIWSLAWAICCRAGENYGRVAVINGENDRFVANSFVEFIDAYTRDHSELL